MKPLRGLPAICLLVCAVMLAGCKFDDELVTTGPPGPPPPAPGTLKVVLASPNMDDSAILVRVTGPQVNTPQLLASGVLMFHRTVTAGTLEVILVGAPESGDLFTIDVPDAVATDYTAAVREVSDANEALRPDLSGYSASVSLVQPATP